VAQHVRAAALADGSHFHVIVHHAAQMVRHSAKSATCFPMGSVSKSRSQGVGERQLRRLPHAIWVS
jgi:hypothetical protein